MGSNGQSIQLSIDEFRELNAHRIQDEALQNMMNETVQDKDEERRRSRRSTSRRKSEKAKLTVVAPFTPSRPHDKQKSNGVSPSTSSRYAKSKQRKSSLTPDENNENCIKYKTGEEEKEAQRRLSREKRERVQRSRRQSQERHEAEERERMNEEGQYNHRRSSQARREENERERMRNESTCVY